MSSKVQNSTATETGSGRGTQQPTPPKHTPGPWIVADRSYDTHLRQFIGANHGLNDGVWVAETKGPDAIANGRLVAAAPELLHLARAVRVHFYGTDAPLGEQAHAIIAKIEGRP